MCEYWLMHPVDGVLDIYLLGNGAYGKPAVQELVGTTNASVLPQVGVDWAWAMWES